MITIDTSALVVLGNRKDADWQRVSNALRDAGPPAIIPASILSEIAYVVEARLGTRAMDVLLDDLVGGSFTLQWDPADLGRIRDLTRRYADMPLGFTDAAVIACAERNRGLVLSIDSDFRVVEREGTIRVLP